MLATIKMAMCRSKNVLTFNAHVITAADLSTGRDGAGSCRKTVHVGRNTLGGWGG